MEFSHLITAIVIHQPIGRRVGVDHVEGRCVVPDDVECPEVEAHAADEVAEWSERKSDIELDRLALLGQPNELDVPRGSANHLLDPAGSVRAGDRHAIAAHVGAVIDVASIGDVALDGQRGIVPPRQRNVNAPEDTITKPGDDRLGT